MNDGDSKRSLSSGPSICKHAALNLEPSANATEVGYCRPTREQRAAATTRQGSITSLQNKRKKEVDLDGASSFPAPLVLPGDELSLDPSYPPQSLRSWVREKERNKVTEERDIIYVVGPPAVTSAVDFLCKWSHPKSGSHGSHEAPPRFSHTLSKRPRSERMFETIDTTGAPVDTPSVKDVKDYLTAFYHGMAVKCLQPPRLSFTSWVSGKSKLSKVKDSSKVPQFIGFSAFSNCTRIRIRSTEESPFPGQLNLDDLLDAAVDMLPDDAYALVLLVNHDLFEDEDDEFVCGRAYGGSRVAVISTARYNPELDETQNVEREHAWPASHCSAYVKSCRAESSRSTTKPKKKVQVQNSDSGQPASLLFHTIKSDGTFLLPPLEAAVSAYSALPSTFLPTTSLSNLWLSRVCRTASHELGHCFGMDHCIYYACSMQGSGSLAEDSRQPPYLCPIDLAKLLEATGTDAIQRYKALLAFCDKRADGHLFAAFAAWIHARLEEMKTSELL